MDYFKRFDDIDKVLVYKREVYVPIIYKHDDVFESSSVWVMYAKRNAQSFGRKVLFAVNAGCLERGLAKFVTLYDEYCASKVIVEGQWNGKEPYVIDLDIKA